MNVRKPFRHRRFVLLASLTISLGVGANLAVLTLVRTLWIRTPVVPEVDRVVSIVDRTRRDARFTDLALTRFRETGLFDGVAGQLGARGIYEGLIPRISLPGTSRNIETLGVTSEYFRVLRLPLVGRDFSAEDDHYGSAPVAIISDDLWREQFGRRADIIGAILPFRPWPIQIIGIAPTGFHGAFRGENANLWLPHRLVPQLLRIPLGELPENQWPMVVLCRLRQGVDLGSVQGSFATSSRPSDRLKEILPLRRFFEAPDSALVVVTDGRLMLVVALIAGLLLAGACATLTALALVHFERRRRDFAIRLSLGASPRALAAQLFGELSIPALAGGAGALLTAAWTLRVMPSLRLPGGVDLARLHPHLDWLLAVLAFAAACLVVAFAAAIAIRRVTRPCVATVLGTPNATGSRHSLRLRRIVLVLHVAATTVVTLAAAVFVQSVSVAVKELPAFDRNHTLFVEVQTRYRFERGGDPEMDGRRAARALSSTRTLRATIEGLPGVRSVALGRPPLRQDADATAMLGQVNLRTADEAMKITAGWLSAGAGYLETIGVPLVAGRAGVGAVEAVVSPALAAQLWPDVSPVGQYLKIDDVFAGTVVGVADMSYGALAWGRPALVVTFDLRNDLAALRGSGRVPLAIRAANPETLRRAVSAAIQDSFPDAAYSHVWSGNELVDGQLGNERLGAWFFSGFGIVALVLAAGSVFGLAAYFLEGRIREFGIQMALGASTGRLKWTVVQSVVGPAATGAGLGLLLAALLGPSVRSLLLVTKDLDAVTFAAVASMCLASSGLAALLAGRRIHRISPLDALRGE